MMRSKLNLLTLIAVCAMGAVSATTANATVASNGIGDLAIIPYYTVQDDWQTGIHITNATEFTQVLKFRMRRGSDSADALDFNIILSPLDVWVANIQSNNAGDIVVSTTDNSCTAPLLSNGIVTMPSTYRQGAEEGYIEVIGMAQISVSSPIGRASKHGSDGKPLSCTSVRSNFLVDSVTAYNTSQQSGSNELGTQGTNTYSDVSNGLKVSYFIRDAASGIEFGNSAIHIQDFQVTPTMTHQQYGLTSFATEQAKALNGFDWPDLNGGGLNTLVDAASNPVTSGQGRDRYDKVIRADLGFTAVLNDWSYNATNGVATDWIVTLPGQYTMVDFIKLTAFLDGATTATWDYRDIPVTAEIQMFDREEAAHTPGGLVISPSPAPDTTELQTEVNVIQWGPSTNSRVFTSAYNITVDPSEAGIGNPFGWARLSVTPGRKLNLAGTGTVPQSVCDLVRYAALGGLGGATVEMCVPVVNLAAPMIGFAAWQRTFSDAKMNYGRIVEHGYITN